MKPAHMANKGGNKGGHGRSHPPMNKMDSRKLENDCFMYQMAILVGCNCEVTVRDGRKFEGVFAAYTSDKRELIIEAAHLVTEGMTEDSPIQSHCDVLVVPADKMLSIRFRAVDVNYATRDFATDTAISGARGPVRDKELTPWDGDADEDGFNLDTDVALIPSTKENGWQAKDMFKMNEEKYGVTSSYTDDLAGYTTQIKKSDSHEWKKLEEEAARIAQEIEKNQVSWQRTELENGEDEEAAFSAVVRPGRQSNVNNNNTPGSAGNSDKYIPPSRRMGNAQPSAQSMTQGVSMNNNGAGPMNAGPRNKMYQNQNPRGGYGGPPNNSYHDRRNNYDNRRGPPPNQYPPPGSQNEGPPPGRGRPPMDDQGPPGRQQRVPIKSNDRRGGRDDPSKINNYRGMMDSGNQPPRRMPMNQQQQPPPSVQQPVTVSVASAGGEGITAGHPTTPSPPSVSSNKSQKEEPSVPPPSASAQQPSAEVEKNTSNSGATSATTSPPVTSGATPVVSAITPQRNEPGTPVSIANTPDTTSTTTSSTPSTDTPKSEGKKFTFNPNAKEFNPCAKTFRSPSTPPRPPSTPAQATTPQMLQTQQLHSYVPIPMPMIYAAQPYTAQSASLTPSSNSSSSPAGNTPRHGGPKRGQGGGMMGGPPRSDMTPPIQMTGPPLLVPAGMPTGTGHQHYAYAVPQGPFPPQVMRIPQGMYNPSDGNGAPQMHQQVHYIPHSGAPTPNSLHQNNSTPSNTPNPPSVTPVVSANGQGYNQGGNPGGAPHVSFPYPTVLPVMNVGYSHGPPQMMVPTAYVPSHPGGAAVIPQSQ